MTPRPGHGAVRWLTAQAVLFGVMAALLGIAANAMFLGAYGPGWLPLTYILIGAAGAAVSSGVAGSARRFDLVRIAVVVLGAAAVVLFAAWAVAADGTGSWVSGPLLVLFPVLIQLGFVFIGAQAGRVLDIAGIKGSFPRIVAGFPVGAVIGGLLAAPLVDVLGGTEGLLLATAVAQAAFTATVVVTGIRYAGLLAVAPSRAATADRVDEAAVSARAGSAERGMRHLLSTRFVVLLMGYQVLSALASQLSDYLVFDRAAARYAEADQLARFLAGYTAVMNLVSIAFLVVVAGALLRRHGLRLGISANPVVLTAGAVAMVIVLVALGGASLALLLTVSAVRILDIALTDGTTRTSINAMYQVLPERDRLGAQATIEGVGVPVAIAMSGVLVLGLNLLPWSLPALILATLAVCLAWVWVGVRLYREYGPALVGALQPQPLLGPTVLPALPHGTVLAETLLESPDPRSARLGLELVSAMATPSLLPEIGRLADDPRSEVRLTALEALASSGDLGAQGRLADEIQVAARDDDAAMRVRAALGAPALDDVDRVRTVELLLQDDSAEVRTAALDAVRSGDDTLVGAVVEAVGDPSTAVPASDAVGRLGEAVLRAMDRALQRAAFAGPESSEARAAVRLVRALRTESAAGQEVLLRWTGHTDRDVGRVVLERLARQGPAGEEVAPVLDDVLDEDLAHAMRVLAALDMLDADSPRTAAGDGPLRRALIDELALIRDRVVATLVARHGRERLGPVLAGLLGLDGPDALAVEALEVVLGSEEAARVTPVLDGRPTAGDRLRRLRAATGVTSTETDAGAILRDLVEDRGDVWRSTWVRTCAIRAANARGVASSCDFVPALALGDSAIDEELDLIS
jgi:hypothetical protein